MLPARACPPTAGANRKAVKRRGQELAYRLRHMARSKHRGGQHPNLSEQLAAAEAGWDEDAAAEARQRRGKRRQSRSAALEQLTRAAALPVEDASRVRNLDQVLGGEVHSVVAAEEAAQAAAEREAAASRSSIAQGGSLYDTPAALAYAASRMPACYAALSRALGEVAQRRPGWRPASQLDFGAGPGTAVWAAQQVWRQAPLDALAVEPSGAMSWLGHEIQQAAAARYEAAAAAAAARVASREDAASGSGASSRTASGSAAAAVQEEGSQEEEEEEQQQLLPPPPPRLRWMHKLPPKYRAAQGKQYDLVTAGYVLGELRSDTERRWGGRGGCLGKRERPRLGRRAGVQGGTGCQCKTVNGIDCQGLLHPALPRQAPPHRAAPAALPPAAQAPGAAAVGAHRGRACPSGAWHSRRRSCHPAGAHPAARGRCARAAGNGQQRRQRWRRQPGGACGGALPP